jgi:hypothetical protein
MRSWLVACAFVSWSGTLLACGTCIEDKVAATYDWAVEQSAKRAGHVVVYCEVQGAFEPGRLAVAARRVHGVDSESVRVSREPAALSFALDTRKQPVGHALEALRKDSGARIAVVRVNAFKP